MMHSTSWTEQETIVHIRYNGRLCLLVTKLIPTYTSGAKNSVFQLHSFATCMPAMLVKQYIILGMSVCGHLHKNWKLQTRLHVNMVGIYITMNHRYNRILVMLDCHSNFCIGLNAVCCHHLCQCTVVMLS